MLGCPTIMLRERRNIPMNFLMLLQMIFRIAVGAPMKGLSGFKDRIVLKIIPCNMIWE